MARYIDIDEYLKDTFCDKFDDCTSEEECLECWAKRNTEDVAPVVHAEWKILENDYAYDDMFTYECSNCLVELCMVSDDLAPYCHNCGAKMDKE